MAFVIKVEDVNLNLSQPAAPFTQEGRISAGTRMHGRIKRKFGLIMHVRTTEEKPDLHVGSGSLIHYWQIFFSFFFFFTTEKVLIRLCKWTVIYQPLHRKGVIGTYADSAGRIRLRRYSGHRRSLIRAFVVHLKNHLILLNISEYKSLYQIVSQRAHEI